MRMTRYGSGGPPLVFVHGLACDGSDWDAQVAWFSSRTTVVVCELPGHGSSPATPAECTIEAYGAALARGLRLPGPAILVGHSMGCRVVVEACRVEPTVVSGLVLIDGSRIGDGDSEAAERAMAAELAGEGYLRFMRKFFESMFVPSSDPAIARMIIERALGLPAPVGRALITDLAGWDAGEVEAALDGVVVPVLAIQTTTMDTARERVSLEPGLSSPWVDLIRAHVPQADVTVLFGAGHFPQIERSDEITALIADFAQL